MASSDEVIRLDRVSIRFGAEKVLEQVSLTLHSQESLVLVGPSGQGKSVLMKLMAGLLNPTSGELFIEGEAWLKIRAAKRKQLLKKMGMLFQKNALFDSLTCSENIAFPLRETTGLSESEIQGRIEQFLEAVGIGHAKNLFPDEISGGMQKRLGIARALALEPEIIFYDDPTAGLDPITSRKIIELIIDLKKVHNSTIVTITNDMNRAYQLADRICMVVDQGIIEAGTPGSTRAHADPKVRQFVRGDLAGPLGVVG